MNIPSGLKPYFKAISILGVLALIGDTALSTMFGFTISPIMGPILAVISLASGLLLVVALFFYRVGWRHMGNGLVAAWALAFAFNCWSNMGVATSNRMGEVQTAGVQKAKHTERRKATEEAETRLKLFTTQLADLSTQNAWAATVSADGLRGQAKNLESSIASEAKRGGCGRICRGLQDQLVEVSNKIAVAEQRDDLTKRIEATKAVLAKARTELAGTDAGISNTANQSALYAKLISWNLASDPDASMVTVANEGTGIATAIILAVIAAALTLVGAWPHLMEAGVGVVSRPEIVRPAASQPQATNPVSDQLEALKAQLASIGVGNGLSLNVIKTGIRDDVERRTALRLAGA